ncbi:MAG: hypothetical protein LAP61_22805 [Acidobacteriia bacterium]|nr:hypothetical protein [Terriglobia bacterium]
MNSVPEISKWQEGQVDRTKEHFEVRYDSAEDSGWSEWIPVAVVGPPIAGIVNVQFLIEPSHPRNADIVSDVAREIQFYLIDKRERKPWAYARYHCGTFANVFSKVHWSFWEPANKKAVLTRKRRAAGKKAAKT